RSAQRHLLVVVAIQNEALMAAAKPSTDGATALYRSAAAEELVRERDEALARMRGAGLVVLDVPPARMAAAVVNRYLEIKAPGQLQARVGGEPLYEAQRLASDSSGFSSGTVAMLSTGGGELRRRAPPVRYAIMSTSVVADTASLAHSGQLGIGETKPSS